MTLICKLSNLDLVGLAIECLSLRVLQRDPQGFNLFRESFYFHGLEYKYKWELRGEVRFFIAREVTNL